MSLIIRAAVLANQLHQGQVRKYTGMPYINHPGRVAARVTRLGMDEEAVAAAWLHDTVEDCGITVRDLGKLHGMPLATCLLVHELTNPSRTLPELNRQARKAMDRTHASQASVEARMIKMADRIDNLREMDLSDEFTKTYLHESTQLLNVLNGTHAELEKELLDVCHGLAKSIEAYKHTNKPAAPDTDVCDQVMTWLKGAMGGSPSYLNDYNPDHFRIVVDLLPLFDIVGGDWKVVSDRIKRQLAAKTAAQST